jgi:hypothetical protein
MALRQTKTLAIRYLSSLNFISRGPTNLSKFTSGRIWNTLASDSFVLTCFVQDSSYRWWGALSLLDPGLKESRDD